MAQAAAFFGVGLLLVLLGLILATDFRGITTKHIALSSNLVGPISPFRRGRTEDDLRQRQFLFVVLERLLGCLFVLMGAGLVVAAVISLFVE
ncbi:hypothetical protein GCM10010399_34300 [Dactylosporangium fulvum]|uniref:Uncharacterized protein n=1 Tax=Dactylosporangium fulvum TaxID=53359 RepID=A0ABY5W1A1_9ACTN|nr:hypothetical protein [Dactylosporangium fulvum]UWP83165.1 hypothetical protein Dfulv_02325 [Dactylosporangium fulvum]